MNPVRSCASPGTNTSQPGAMSPSRPMVLGWAWCLLCLRFHQAMLSPTTRFPMIRENHSLRRPLANTCWCAASWPRNAAWVNRTPNRTATASCHQVFPRVSSRVKAPANTAARIAVRTM